MGKDSKKSGIPVFGEVINLLNKQEINKIAEELKSDRYTKRLDSYQHLSNIHSTLEDWAFRVKYLLFSAELHEKEEKVINYA